VKPHDKLGIFSKHWKAGFGLGLNRRSSLRELMYASLLADEDETRGD
jgi:hypothetical protein